LNVRLKLAAGDPSHFGADAAKILGFATVRDLVPEGGFFAGEITNAWHRILPHH
jgi:hypothetical protein